MSQTSTERLRDYLAQLPPQSQARLLFRPLEPFLVDGSFPIRPGQIRRASLGPVWQWLIRDGAAEAAKEFEAALSKARETGMNGAIEPSVRKFQLAAANAIVKVATPVPREDKHRALARVGAPSVIEDLTPIGAVLQAREALETLNSKLPGYLRVFGEAQVASTTASLNVPSLQTPQLLPFALSLIMQRLTAP